jgi:hypothetical protein
MILTKKPWIYDPIGDTDKDDITDEYKNKEGMMQALILSRFTLYCLGRKKSVTASGRVCCNTGWPAG